MKEMITDEPRFLKWAGDEPMQYPSGETFRRWEVFGWVRPAEEGWALTTKGRALAEGQRR